MLKIEDAAGLERPPCRRGTTNRNERGNSKDRRRRREWLVETYRADVDVIEIQWVDGHTTRWYPDDRAQQDAWLKDFDNDDVAVTIDHLPACRCYRCGCLLTADTVTVDRIKPGCEGGKYRTPLRDRRDGVTNIRPACGLHNSETGGALGAARKAAMAS